MSVVLKIEKMKCGGCVNTIKTALEAHADVTKATVSLDEQQAIISGDISSQQAENTVTALGFPAKSINE